MIERKFGDHGGFFTLFIAGCVILVLITGEWALITNNNNNKTYNNILSILLAALIIWFSYMFVMGIKYYYTGNKYTGKEKQNHYKKFDEYMISLWIMMCVTLGCSIGYSAAVLYL